MAVCHNWLIKQSNDVEKEQMNHRIQISCWWYGLESVSEHWHKSTGDIDYTLCSTVLHIYILIICILWRSISLQVALNSQAGHSILNLNVSEACNQKNTHDIKGTHCTLKGSNMAVCHKAMMWENRAMSPHPHTHLGGLGSSGCLGKAR